MTWDSRSLIALDPTFGSDIPPLLDRGWVLQQMLLSTRIISFNEPEISFECADGYHCQCNPSWERLIRPPHERTVWSTAMSVNPALTWISIVSAYSRLKLTHPTDELAALSGIVRKCEDYRLGDQYLLGL
jgi:hypothetical protein